jgi:hypothetical protein
LLYPLLNTLLLILVLTLAFYMGRGRLWRPWLLIALSVIAASFGDLFYTYLDINDLYYAEHTILLSRASDWMYIADYILYGWGLAELYLIWQEVLHPRFQKRRKAPIPPHFTNMYGLLYLDGEDRVIDKEGPLWEHLSHLPQEGEHLSEALGTTSASIQEILSTLKKAHKVLPIPLHLTNREGRSLMVHLSGVAVAPGKIYEGANLLLHTFVPGHEPLTGFSEEGFEMVRFLARETGVHIPNYRQAILRYTQTLWTDLIQTIQQYLGPLTALGVLERLQAVYDDIFILSINGLELTEQAAAEPSRDALQGYCKGLLNDLLQTMQQFLSKPLSLYELYQAEQRLDTETLWIAEELGLRPYPQEGT